MTFKPMLSGKAPDDLSALKYPLAVSPKLDGFRAIIIDGVVMSRNLKPIRNKHVQRLYGRPEFNGFDGELIVGDPTAPDCFNKTSSGVTSAAGEPDVTYYVFDNYLYQHGWKERFVNMNHGQGVFSNDIIFVEHTLCFNKEGVLEQEELFLNQGYEGLMIRALDSPYKMGRSTTREGWLLKLKRFEDSEALVIGMEEKGHNANEAKINALGHIERASFQENIIGMKTMGALIVKDIKTNIEFNIGTGFDDATRDMFWKLSNCWSETIQANNTIIRKTSNPSILVKYKHFAIGIKDKPRFPTYLGIRHEDDLST